MRLPKGCLGQSLRQSISRSREKNSRLKGSDRVGVFGFRKLFGELADDVESSVDVLAVSVPGDGSSSTTVVEPVLTTRSSMDIDVDANTVLGGPPDGAEQVGVLPRDVRLPRLDVERPVTDGDTNVVPTEVTSR